MKGALSLAVAAGVAAAVFAQKWDVLAAAGAFEARVAALIAEHAPLLVPAGPRAVLVGAVVILYAVWRILAAASKVSSPLTLRKLRERSGPACG